MLRLYSTSSSTITTQSISVFPALAGQLGDAYAIPILYVPMLMITHFAAFYWLVRPQTKAAPVLIGDATES
jgi:hypothetical protein